MKELIQGKHMKRILTLFIAVTMIITLMPVNTIKVYAADDKVAILYYEDFENGSYLGKKFGSPSLSIQSGIGVNNSKALLVSEREENYYGYAYDVTQAIGKEISLNAKMAISGVDETEEIYIAATIKTSKGGEDDFYNLLAGNNITGSEFVTLSGSYTIPEDCNSAFIYFEAPTDVAYILDDVEIIFSYDDNDTAAAGDVITKIEAIGTVSYTEECKTRIEAARSAYDALTAVQKELVTNYAYLTSAESEYAELKNAGHTWSYSAGTGNDSNKLTAKCNRSDHESEELATTGVTLTLSVTSPTYSGSAAEITVGSLSEQATWKAVFGENSIPIVHYVGRDNTRLDDTTNAPTAVGKYTAKITVGTATATADYEIKEADPVVPTIDQQPAAKTVTAGDTATFSVSASVSDGGILSYQWYIDKNTGNFVAIDGATNTSYTTTATTIDCNGYKYYCKVTNTKNSQTKDVSSNTVELTVNEPTPSHIHNYATTWSGDGTKHWHVCTSTTGTCDTPEKDIANHTWENGSCSVCTYVCTHGGATSGTCATCGKSLGSSGGSGGGSDTPSTPPTSTIPTTPTSPTTSTITTENYTVELKIKNMVKIEAEVKDGTAIVSEITNEIIDKIVSNTDKESKEDTILIDLSGAKQEVTGVTFSKKTVETLAKAITDKKNSIETVTIELSKATVVMDNKTLKTMVDQAKGLQIELVVVDKQQKNLNSVQQTTLKEYQVTKTFEAYITSDGQRIYDFNGGKVVVSIDFTPEVGKDTSYYRMIHVAKDGKVEPYKTKYEKLKLTFTTTHFSDFAVIYDTNEKNETKEQSKEDEKKDHSTATEMKETLDTKMTLDTSYRKLRLRVPTSTKTTNVLKWTKVSGADGYVIYGNKCNSNGKTYKMLHKVVIKDGATTTWTDKGLSGGTYYKYYIKAYKLVKGKKVWLAKSKVVHSTTTGGKYGNAKSVKVNKTSLSLTVGKKFTIKAEEIQKDLSIKNHTDIKFESSNSKIASVNSEGVINAKKKGTCNIYAYAQNGMYKKIVITVK